RGVGVVVVVSMLGLAVAMLTELRTRKGLPKVETPLRYMEMRERNQERWAEFLAEHLDMKFIEGLI
ncbi:hypothetical protein ACFLZI_02430, partial [Nitrospirota bacterium]